jgi:hypothetical protein
MDLTPQKIIKNSKDLHSSRPDFDSFYQTLHNYFYVDGANITAGKNKGSESDFVELLDATSFNASDILAAGLSNYLTPAGSKWLFLEHSNPYLREDKQVIQWMQDVTEEVMLTLSRSNFYNQMPIFYKGSGVYGTSGLFCEKDFEDGVRFYNIPIKKLYLTEDAREKPNEFYLDFEYTAEQAMTKWGDKCSQAIKDSYASGRNEDKKHHFICYFGKRLERDAKKNNKENMPIRMVWVDKTTGEKMSEDGFNSMPCVAHRFYKRPQIVYGYSPAMKALPFARLINTMTDTILRSSMKQVDPAIALPDDAFLGNLNFNPRQLNFYRRGNLDPSTDIVPIGAYGNVSIGIAEIEYYKNMVNDIMFVNAFNAFGDITKQMTIPEVQERINEKMTLLGPAVGRYMSDVLQPLIEKVVFTLWEGQRLPQMPDVMLQDPRFEVKFVGRLVQSQRQSEVNNIMTSLQIASQIAAFKPEAIDKINGDNAIDEIWQITGANAEIINSNEEVSEIRQQRAQMEQMQQAMMAGQQVADITKTASEADRNNAETQNQEV